VNVLIVSVSVWSAVLLGPAILKHLAADDPQQVLAAPARLDDDPGLRVAHMRDGSGRVLLTFRFRGNGLRFHVGDRLIYEVGPETAAR
jgi:hypothetical protein